MYAYNPMNVSIFFSLDLSFCCLLLVWFGIRQFFLLYFLVTILKTFGLRFRKFNFHSTNWNWLWLTKNYTLHISYLDGFVPFIMFCSCDNSQKNLTILEFTTDQAIKSPPTTTDSKIKFQIKETNVTFHWTEGDIKPII